MDWAAISAFLKVFPKLIDLAERLGLMVKEYNLEQYIQEVDTSVKTLEEPTSSLSARKDAARKLLDLTSKL